MIIYQSRTNMNMACPTTFCGRQWKQFVASSKGNSEGQSEITSKAGISNVISNDCKASLLLSVTYPALCTSYFMIGYRNVIKVRNIGDRKGSVWPGVL